MIFLSAIGYPRYDSLQPSRRFRRGGLQPSMLRGQPVGMSCLPDYSYWNRIRQLESRTVLPSGRFPDEHKMLTK